MTTMTKTIRTTTTTVTMTMAMVTTMTMMTESQICPPLPTLLFQCGLYALFTIYKPARQFNVQHLLAALKPPLTPPQSLHCLRSPNCQIIWENPLVRGRLDQSVILGFLNHETLTLLWILERTCSRQLRPNLGGSFE